MTVLVRFIFIVLPLCLSLHLIGCSSGEHPHRPFDSEGWKSGDDEIRGQMVHDLLERKLLVRKTKKEVIKLLGQPDEEDPRFITYFFYDGDEFSPPPLVHVEMSKDQIVKDVWISD